MNASALFLLLVLGQPFGEGAGVNIHFTHASDQELDLLQGGGFRWVRMDFAWDGVEREPGKFDFSAYDHLHEITARRGIRNLWIIDYGHSKHTGGLPPSTAEERALYARFAGAAAARFKGKNILWEIWNEPNIKQFWKPAPNAEHYTVLVKEAVPAIRQADPEARVAVGATSGIDLRFLEACFAGGLLDFCDIVTVHPYRRKAPETAAPEILRLRNLLARYAPRREIPIYSGEWGYTSKDHPVDEQARYLARQQIHNRLLGLPLSIWYDWKDDGPDPNEREHRFGTVEYETLKPKPAYNAIRNLTRHLGAFEPRGRLELGDDQVYIALFAGEGGAIRLAAWSEEKKPAVKIPVGGASMIEAVALDGSSRRVEPQGGTVELDLGVDPVLLILEPGAKERPDFLRFALSCRPEKPWAPVRGTEPAALRLLIEGPPSGSLQGQVEVFCPEGVRIEGPPSREFAASGPGPARVEFKAAASRALDAELTLRYAVRLDGMDRDLLGRWTLLFSK
ncbi:MAG: cellulase family glycosylhydrolase [Planctomycetes bacterium]|nr:cellulase family glycosylhydrolase [Planctomycetota bacterium]